MPTRILVPPTLSSFPRWGFLDKYAVNEYLPRAFLLTVLIALSFGAGLRMWPSNTASPVRIVRLSSPDIIEIGPPPTMIRPKPMPSRGGGLSTRPIVPVPVPNPAIDVEQIDGGTVANPWSEGVEAPGVDDSEVYGGPVVGDAWPSPDDLVVVEHEPVLIAMQAPVYPEIARDAGIEGTVLVRVLVDVQGSVREAQILQSVLGLDEAALAAARTAAFRPALQQDRPVAVWVVIPIEFRLYK